VPVARTGARVSEELRSRGVRLTAQRRLVVDLLERATRHLDAEAVYRLAHHKDPSIHRATVYRTLNTLKKHGLVDELDLMHVRGTRHYYEVRPSVLHIHLICTACGKVQEPAGRFWEGLKRRVRSQTGFRPEVVRLEMGGVCVDCQDRPPRPPGVRP